ncbi:hypothetical protein BC831DRAFT_512662 [Entophlyctis helioformis]|nr:hypothetical protein BC831DRAFT_512662 [Entophlyctis helioformis]
MLRPLEASFEGDRSITAYPDNPILLGRAIDPSDTAPQPTALKFVSKVVSRKHALLVYQDRKLYLQDTKSSSGTFLNEQRLSPQGTESAKVELRSGDIIRMGEDCEVNGVMHKSVAMTLYFVDGESAVGLPKSTILSPGHVRMSMNSLPPSAGGGGLSMSTSNLNRSDASLSSARSNDMINMGETQIEPYMETGGDLQFRLDVDNEFNAIWTSLTQGLDSQSVRHLKHVSKAHALSMMTQGIYAAYSAGSGSGIYGSQTELSSSNPRQSFQNYLGSPHSSEGTVTDTSGGSGGGGGIGLGLSGRLQTARMSRLPGSPGNLLLNSSRVRQSSALSASSNTSSTTPASPAPLSAPVLGSNPSLSPGRNTHHTIARSPLV